MDLYIAEAKYPLSDTMSYLLLDHDPTLAHQAIVSHIAHDLIISGDIPSITSNLIHPQPLTARFYLVPKFHKPNYPGQPIISACSFPTDLISSHLDSILFPLVQALPPYIRATNHALYLF
eukprot:g27778.t1